MLPEVADRPTAAERAVAEEILKRMRQVQPPLVESKAMLCDAADMFEPTRPQSSANPHHSSHTHKLCGLGPHRALLKFADFG